MGGLDNPLHLALLVVILLLVFGARKLPEIGRSLGSGMREFKEGISSSSGEPSTTEARATLPEQNPTEQQAADAFGEPAKAEPPKV